MLIVAPLWLEYFFSFLQTLLQHVLSKATASYQIGSAERWMSSILFWLHRMRLLAHYGDSCCPGEVGNDWWHHIISMGTMPIFMTVKVLCYTPEPQSWYCTFLVTKQSLKMNIRITRITHTYRRPYILKPTVGQVVIRSGPWVRASGLKPACGGCSRSGSSRSVMVKWMNYSYYETNLVY